jgi:peptidoglycan/LPS O-acetylase OafA/YrhL
MGVLRLLLALSVLISHAGLLFNYDIVNSSVAVLSFFIISGFYMEMILDKKYAKKSTFLFLSNRFLRIFPLYWVTLFIIFSLTLLKFALHLGTDDNAIVHYIKWAPQTTPFIFGLDLFNFIIRNITLIFTFDYIQISNSTPGYLLVQQAWTLQIELLFYLLAPFFTRLTNKLFITVFLVYIIGFFGIADQFNLLQHNLVYTFLNYLVYFLVGMMSYRFLYKKFQAKTPHPYLAWSIFLFFFLYLFLYNLIPFRFSVPILQNANIFYYITLVFSIPYIFFLSSTSVIDGFIGKLSYPVYITHFLVIKLLSNISLFKDESNIRTFLVIIFTGVLSFLMMKIIEYPIDKYRQARVKAT